MSICRGWYLGLLAGFVGLSGCASGPPLLTEVPFESPRHQIVVQVMMQGEGPFNMLLDTGTDPSAVDMTLARRLRAPADTILHRGQGAGNDPIRAFAWRIHDLRLGAIERTSVAALAIDLRKIGAQLGTRLDGVLGYSLLEGCIVQIDYPSHRVRFYRRPPPPTHAHVAELDMQIDPEDPTPRIMGSVNGRPARLLYDSGSSGSVAISQQAVQRLGLQREFAAAAPESAFGYGGRAETREGWLPSFAIGSLHYENVRCTFGGHDFGALSDTSRALGKFGNALLEDAIVTLDYKRKKLRIER